LGGGEGWVRKELFFFEKKNQKTFAIQSEFAGALAELREKFFGSFFQKRTPSFRRVR
jgi:hypothetical protein